MRVYASSQAARLSCLLPHIAGPDSIWWAMPLVEAIAFIYALPAMLRPQNGFRIGHEILKINSFYLIIRMV